MVLRFLSVLLLLIFVSVCEGAGRRDDDGELKCVMVLHRHGDRGPLHLWSEDIANWPDGASALTPIGMQQVYQLGQSLRRRYQEEENFIPQYFSPDLVHCLSSAVDRTLMSAQGVLTGLYPQGPTLDDGSPPIPGQPQLFPIHSLPKDEDLVLRGSDNCGRYTKSVQSLRTTAAWNEKEMEESDLLDTISHYFYGEPVRLETLWMFADMLTCEEAHGLEDPRGFPQNLVPSVQSLYDWVVQQQFSPGFLGRLSGGALLERIRQDMLDNVEATSPVKMHLYSAHDSTVTAFLAALGVQPQGMPPYTSHVVVELRKKGRDYWVTVEHDEVLLSVPGCSDEVCELQEFLDATEESSLVEPWAACYVNEEEPSAASSSIHSVLHEPEVVDPNLVPGAQQGEQFDWDTLYWVLAGLAGLSGVAVAVCFFRPRCKRSQPVSMDNADVELQMMEELDDGKFD